MSSITRQMARKAILAFQWAGCILVAWLAYKTWTWEGAENWGFAGMLIYGGATVFLEGLLLVVAAVLKPHAGEPPQASWRYALPLGISALLFAVVVGPRVSA